MDPVLLSRIQFAGTIGFHFIFAPLTIGLAWLIFWIMTRYWRTGAEIYRRMARFWISLFAISFVMGVVSGLTMEFQFGTNWAKYSHFVGDIFGAPLAVEVVFAFFIESTFLGILLYGWNRVSRTVLWVASLAVAVGSTSSAFWILAANSWMQTPTAFVLRNGRAELTSFWGAINSPSMLPRFLHTVDAAVITGAFFMLGISAWFLLKNRHVATARITLTLALAVGFLASVAVAIFGHAHAVQVAKTQPEKLAAIEGLFETQTQAPLLLFGVPDAERREVRYAIGIPGGLSWLAHGDPNAKVTGLDAFPREEWPPLAITFYSFHLMVLLGLFFIGFTGLGLLLLWRRKLYEARWYLVIAMLAIPLPFLANELGWITAEVGRQPWIVYRLMLTRDAISVNVPASHILASIIMFGVVYALMFVAWITLLRREITRGPEEEPAVQMEAVV
jgi:cytochrome d ubiquinol oxidase subunit I